MGEIALFLENHPVLGPMLGLIIFWGGLFLLRELLTIVIGTSKINDTNKKLDEIIDLLTKNN